MLKDLSRLERRNFLFSEYKKKYGSRFLVDFGHEPELTSYMMSSILEDHLPVYLSHKENRVDKMSDEFDKFYEKNLPDILDTIENELESCNNLYNMFNLPALATGNKVTRSLSTRFGSFWEKVALLSNNVVSTEEEFGFKMKGVDVILFLENVYYYIQMKTKEDTLTAGKSSSVDDDLHRYNNKYFVSCVETSSNWTYNGNIEKIKGKEFWNMCGIDYDLFLSNIKRILTKFEKLL